MAEYSENVAQAAAVLGTIFYQDPASEKGKTAFSWLAANGADAWEFGQPAAGEALELMKNAWLQQDDQAIHEEYNRLFIGPHRLPAPPWASVYTDPEGVIFGNATLGVRQWMRDNAVKLSLPDKEPEDHFGLMLMMLSWCVCSRGRRISWSCLNGERSIRCIRVRRVLPPQRLPIGRSALSWSRLLSTCIVALCSADARGCTMGCGAQLLRAGAPCSVRLCCLVVARLMVKLIPKQNGLRP